MVEHITALGTTTKWKVKVFSPGQMAEVTKVITTTIRKRDKVLSSGLMVENTWENGRIINRMELELTFLLAENQRKVSGKKVKDSIGYTMYETILFHFNQFLKINTIN